MAGNLPEPVRDVALSFKCTGIEAEEIRQCAKLAGVSVSEWVRELALGVARGKRTEVRTDDLAWLRASLDRLLAVELETLRTLHEHTDHIDGPDAEIAARRRADEKMARALDGLGFGNGDGR